MISAIFSERWTIIMDILQVIKEILAKQLKVDVDTIDENTNIVADLGADSLDVVEMLMTIEEEYDVVVPDEVVTTFVTVGDVARYVESNQ
jgi:acyl carrier protein